MNGTHTSKKKRDVPHIKYNIEEKDSLPWECDYDSATGVGDTPTEAYENCRKDAEKKRIFGMQRA